MVATVLDGKAVAADIRQELKQKIEDMHEKPGLGVILVGDREDSATYVRMKEVSTVSVGFSRSYRSHYYNRKLARKLELFLMFQNSRLHRLRKNCDRKY